MYNRYSPEIDIQPLNNRYITLLNLRGGPRQYLYNNKANERLQVDDMLIDMIC